MPASIATVDELEDLLSTPSPAAIEALAKCPGDLVVLGVGGKMGPTLARMAVRAFREAGLKRRVVGVSRFREAGLPERLRRHGVETIACDLLDASATAKLPRAPFVVAMTGMKFGASDQAALTWAMNCHVPAIVCEHFRDCRLVAFSTGNVYPLAPVAAGGSRETDAPAPVGEYAASALGRERMYEYFSHALGTPMSIVRLNYANELRYGVLVDMARKVWQGEPIELAMGHVNVVWQGDANAAALASFAHAASPPFVFNLAGPETVSVRAACEEFGRLLGKSPRFRGQEAPDALLSNGQLGHALFGYPRVSLRQTIEWIADWVRRGGANLGKPTHFETRDGRY